ncbi:hypothetical protein ACS0TY_000421 [Phlomoides rotata]
MDGMVWVANPPKQSLAMILADKGFDVWISNIRGTRFSRRHRKLDSTNPKFWKWTWDDLTLHDLPSIIGFIFKQTGSQIHYVGHSMGTLMALASLSERKLNNVKSAALLSPIAYLSNVRSDIAVVGARAFIGELGAIFGLAEFNPKGDHEAKFFEFLCALLKVDCNDLKTTAITGKNCCLNESIAQNFIRKDPQPTSTRNLVHLSQAIRHGFVCKYDYGNVVENVQNYGTFTPPIYNLSNIPRNFPLFMSYGGEDMLSDVKDVRSLLYDLKSHQKQKLKVQFINKYAHLDFVLGVNAKDIVYNHIVDFFTRHN